MPESTQSDPDPAPLKHVDAERPDSEQSGREDEPGSTGARAGERVSEGDSAGHSEGE